MHLLTERRKWKRQKRSITVDDIMLVKEKNLPRNQWLMGRVVKVYTNSDGLVRSATVKFPPCSTSNLPRSLHRAVCDLVVLLPKENSHS